MAWRNISDAGGREAHRAKSGVKLPATGCKLRGQIAHLRKQDEAPLSRAAVMLHLRARYVSKAAILTGLALDVPVENRSPA
jgi:hypothetical protein